MAKIDLPAGLTPKPTAGGTRFYWQPSPKQRRAGWKGLPLGMDLAAAITAANKRNDEIEAWQLGGGAPAGVRKILRQATVSGLIRQFIAEGWPSVERPGHYLASGTRKEYRSKFSRLEAWAGDAPLTAITPHRVAVFRDELMKPAKSGRWQGQVRHTTAHATLRVGRTLFTYAEHKHLIPKGSNPFDNFGLAMPDPRHQVWSPEAREAVIAEAINPKCLAAREAEAEPSMALAIDLAFTIGQREADLLKLPSVRYVEIPAFKMDADVFETLSRIADDGRVTGIRLRQNKGAKWVEVPVVGATRAAVEAGIERARAAGCTTILIDDRTARPWAGEAGQTRFQRRFAELRAAAIVTARAAGDDELAAELEELQFRDFRRTAVVYLGELGLADHLIAAITGHSLDETKKILDTYMPRTTGMAARAIALSHARAPLQSGALEGNYILNPLNNNGG